MYYNQLLTRQKSLLFIKTINYFLKNMYNIAGHI